jgi:hypothetical protein
MARALHPFVFVLLLAPAASAEDPASWRGVIRDSQGRPIAAAQIRLRSAAAAITATSDAAGAFRFESIPPLRYTLAIERSGQTFTSPPVEVRPGERRVDSITLIGSELVLTTAPARQGTGGEELSSEQVSALPLNKRDFSQLLLLATGTQTDTNGAANFTQQFTVNGQRGTATVFAMDGIDTTDPEMGGATFSNFNVDAIEEIKSESGVLPATIGHGAAGYTEVITKSGDNNLHGSLFEFVRNAVFDARNFFDRRSVAQPGRIPPFIRNEFGFTNGGPVVLPRIYNGRDRTFYFGQYQGFRQVLGTTQVLPVPTAEERTGRNSTAFPGDVLYVPVDPRIAAVLARYPLPNVPAGPYGERTYATSSKVRTTTDQFSIRVDHRLSSSSHLFVRFNLNNVDGPLTNPSQTAIDPSFAIPFFDHQRNFGLGYTRTRAHITTETHVGFIRSTPNFPTLNRTEPGLGFGDGLYEGFNTPAGSIMGAYGNLFQFRQNVRWMRGRHTVSFGGEVRLNRDTTVFDTAPNGAYTFGGGAAYSPVEIRSRSGRNDIHIGDLLPDALSGFLTATPFSYTITAAPRLFAQGQRMGDSAIHREAYNFYIQDNWKVSPRVALTLGLRYEVNSRIKEAKLRTSGVVFEDASGRPAAPDSPGSRVRFLINNQPAYGMDWNGWGPRAAVDWRWNDRTVFHAGGSISTILPNLWQNNFATGGLPFVVAPLMTAAPGAPLAFSNSVVGIELPEVYNVQGEPVYATGKSTDAPPNTEMDVLRYERDLAMLSPDKTVRAVTAQGMASDFRNGYIGAYTAGLERQFAEVTLNANYVATVGVRLARMDYPNGYAGAEPDFARYTLFDSQGQVTGGFGPIVLMTSRSHSTYHSLQVSAEKKSLRAGLGFQASYTFSKSIDDTSAVLGGFVEGSSGAVLQTSPQNPRDLRSEKGPSTFDITHAFSFSAIQELPFERTPFFAVLGRRFSAGWQLLGMATLATGSPFTVYSGVQQTGAGSNGADRPDQVASPVLSTSRAIREDYFGLGVRNASFFSIPINVAGGTGPNHGRFGSLGRNTFRGPAFHNVDLAVIKNTAIGMGANPERVVLQFRAEFFNVFNIVNFGLPANIVLGPGFGLISRTAGPSRQIQFSLKLLY